MARRHPSRSCSGGSRSRERHSLIPFSHDHHHALVQAAIEAGSVGLGARSAGRGGRVRRVLPGRQRPSLPRGRGFSSRCSIPLRHSWSGCSSGTFASTPSSAGWNGVRRRLRRWRRPASCWRLTFGRRSESSSPFSKGVPEDELTRDTGPSGPQWGIATEDLNATVLQWPRTRRRGAPERRLRCPPRRRRGSRSRDDRRRFARAGRGRPAQSRRDPSLDPGGPGRHSLRHGARQAPTAADPRSAQ